MPPAPAPALAALSLLVTHTDGRPAAGLRLDCYVPRADFAPISGRVRPEDCSEEILADNLTGANGTCTVTGLRPGSVYVESALGISGLFTVEAGETAQGRLVLPDGIEVTGRVVFESGLGAPNAPILLHRDPALPEYATIVARSGHCGEFTLPAVAAGSVLVAEYAGYRPSMPVTATANAAGKSEIVLELGSPCDVVRGLVVDADGKPVPGAGLYLGSLGTSTMSPSRAGGARPSCRYKTKSDAEGFFEFPTMPEVANSVLWVYRDGYAVGRRSVEHGERSIRVVLEAECRLSVSIEVPDGMRPEQVSGWYTPRGWGLTGEFFEGPLWARPLEWVGRDSTLRLARLPAGPGTLSFSAPDSPGIAEVITLVPGENTCRVRIEGLDFGPVETTRIRVVDVRGDPLDGMLVRLHPDSGTGGPRSERTDGDGVVSFDSFPIYRRAVVRIYDPTLAWPYPVYQSNDAELSTDQELRMSYARPGAKVAGTVPQGMGADLSGALTVRQGEKTHVIELSCDALGQFEAGPFPEGEYDLRIEFPGLRPLVLVGRHLVSGESSLCGPLVPESD